MSTIVFTGGGTGGHIFPGIAVAENFEKNQVVWIGGKGVDREFVENAGIKFYKIPAGKLRRYFSLQNVVDVFKVAGGFFKSLYLLLKIKPVLVFSKGGFVSVPPCLAAKILRIPVITHECDYSPGLATKLNAKFATKIFISYPQTADFLGTELKKKTVYTGNPVRERFYNANAENGRRFTKCSDSKPMLFVLGGSLGAKQINDVIYENIEFLTEHFYVVHQVGGKNASDIQKIETKLSEVKPSSLEFYKGFEFIRDEMPDVLASSTLVLSRAGANTVWESAATGKPMILIPLDTGSSRGDQLENAEFFRQNNAAVVLTGDDVNTNFCDELQKFIDDKEYLKKIALASKNLAVDKPAVKIANLLKEYMVKIENKEEIL